jgi:hypothetical protein
MRALDMDDAMKLVAIFSKTGDAAKSPDNEPESDLNAQVTDDSGYGGYSWTPWLFNWMGDTILHMAIKMKKRRCVWALLLMGAETTIKNESGKTAEDLSILPEYLHEELSRVAGGARRSLMESVDPRTLDGLPDSFVLRGILTEAWQLMWQGRQTYVELPKCMMENRDKVVVDGVNDGEMKGANLEITDMFARNDCMDVAKTIRNQMNSKLVRMCGNAEKSSGLSLLNEVRRGAPKMSSNLRRTFRDSGLQKLTFMKRGSSYFESLNKEDAPDDPDAPVAKALLADKSSKEITVYSTRTNLKYMRVANYGAKLLGDAMMRNSIIQTLILANARISDPGIEDMVNAFVTMEVVNYIDLSGNAITNTGGEMIVKVLERRHSKYGSAGDSLHKLSLAANRMNDVGLEKLVIAAHAFNLRFLGLHNQRKSTRIGRQALHELSQQLLADGKKARAKEVEVVLGPARGTFVGFTPEKLREAGRGKIKEVVKEDCNVVVINPADSDIYTISALTAKYK